MTVHQPMLFVGLGGTGCRVGRELERVMREGLCGPDGRELMTRLPGHEYLPYQLPPCLQFVYADLSDAELRKVLPHVVPSAEHHAAAQHTTHLIDNLVPPNISGTPRLLQSMYVNLDPRQRAWLPPKESDPRVAPLSVGAGQLPTVGRAVLHESMRQGGGPTAVLDGVTAATKQINGAGAALHALGGRMTNTIDVFVAFSVAGGTGCGIFYDYLHMVGEHLHRTGVEARIYPLVLMPSAFEAGMGGGRAAELNAGAALVDLFRLVDDQNAQEAVGQEGDSSRAGPLSVHLPREVHPTVLQPATVQTAFLFGRPSDGVAGDDLIRSMVSLVVSLIGAGPEGGLPFAEAFINRVITRSAPSATGIGRRGVSTAAVASLTIPLGELADVVSSRLLADAVRAMRSPVAGASAVNGEHIRQFDLDAGLGELRSCKPAAPFQDIGIPPKGHGPIVQALSDRSRAVQAAAGENERTLRARVDELAYSFRPMEAAEALTRSVDPFHLRRVVSGDPNSTDASDRGGVAGLLGRRKVPKDSPAGFDFGSVPPQADGVSTKWLGPLRSTDPSVAQARENQNSWFAWRVEQIWYAAWGASERVWGPRWKDFRTRLDRLLDQFDEHVGRDGQQFAERASQLYSTRLGVSYLLPPDDGGLSAFHERVVSALNSHYQDQLGPNPTAADLVTVILGDREVGSGDGWSDAVRIGWTDPEEAVARVRQRLRAAVAERFRPGGGERSLVPSMADLLAAAVGRPRSPVDHADVAHFRNAVAGLVPGGYAPAGDGELHVLVSHPGSGDDVEIETFLRDSVLLPGDGPTVEYRSNESDSLAVVLFRSGMGLTEVPEVREAIRTWGEAQRHERPGDRLTWRQRLGPVSHYRAVTATDRASILQSLLNAMWNGWVRTGPDGADPADPEWIAIGIGHEDTPPLTLELTSFPGLSSWASVLQSYEEWVLANGTRSDRDLSEQIMRALPRDLDRNPGPPHPLLRTVIGLEKEQLEAISRLRDRPGVSGGHQLAMFEEFWAETLRAALSLPFQGVQAGFGSLEGLLQFFGTEGLQ